jgi:predicted MFS family arabinose efflux permease
VTRFLLYLFPALIDFLVGSFFFISTVRIAESGASPVAISTAITLWGVCYMLGSFFVGRKVTSANCRILILYGCAGMILCSAVFILIPQIAVLYSIMMMFGISVAFFFPPYAVFMKQVQEEHHGDIAVLASEYTMAWSLGLAAGPFAAALIWSAYGWQWSCTLDIVLAGATLAGFSIFSRTSVQPAAPLIPAHAMPSQDMHKKPDLIWLAWIGSGMCLLTVSIIRGVFPASAIALNVPKPDQGITLALLCIGQALACLVVARWKNWMYQARAILLFGCIGIAGLILFGMAHTSPVFYMASLLSGIYAGAAFVYLLFHALIHPTRAGKYVGINEAIVGLSGIVGPVLGGIFAERISLSAPYYISALFICAALVYQIIAHVRMK